MTLAAFLAKTLVEYGATDMFGIPGGAVLDILYACEEQEGITTHLNYHEQAAAYAACGYAQVSGKLGVVYATKGPGVTNYITALAEAYYDSLPVVFLTAHSKKDINRAMRSEFGQEMDTITLVSQYVKYAVRIDDIATACDEIVKACRIANYGRKGPVFLDIHTSLFQRDVTEEKKLCSTDEIEQIIETRDATDMICMLLKKAYRPVFLLGDGIHIANVESEMNQLINKVGIPVLSSRCAQDLYVGNRLYYGFIGSHATRYSNFILEKADLIIALGNRMAYPIESESFLAISEKKIIRIDVDKAEFMRKIPGATNFCVDLNVLIPKLLDKDYETKYKDWLNVCDNIREKLWDIDTSRFTRLLSFLIKRMNQQDCIVCDEGNNELWVSRAYAHAGRPLRLLYSKTFKTVGCALGKAIGAYYALGTKVLCTVGDQGFQFNMQELQFISHHNLPIKIVIINNSSPGMMRSSEKRLGYEYFLHTTLDTGYSNPCFEQIAKAYELEYEQLTVDETFEKAGLFLESDRPGILEIVIEDSMEVEQILPRGNKCTDFIPQLDYSMRKYLEQL